uniref:3-oxoacyl-[acyl-carrier-protein] reductase n=1 Tax=Gambierdiscus polynesiensis TaxID=439318 RepID=A0A6M5KEX5_9DINO|nr:3-oxoacyl carrier protein reductase [Gambierdiscus polynesiensis]
MLEQALWQNRVMLAWSHVIALLLLGDRLGSCLASPPDPTCSTQTLPLQGRSAIVTGASKGIGKGIARILALRGGASVMLVARTRATLEETAKEIEAAGGRVSLMAADISKEADMQRVANSTAELFGGVDILCANAGTFPQTKLEDMAASEWDEIMATNLKGTFLSVKGALPFLKSSDQPRIVLTSSITGPITGYPGWSHYGASKSGQLGFMRTASIELAKYGITVNAVLPGNVLTEGLAEMGDDYLKGVTAAIPLRRLGTVEDIGSAVLFLASKDAGWITGQTLTIDGGQTLPESPDALAEM